MVDVNGNKTGGRQKGTLNKQTALAKDAINMAAERIGGVERLVAWIEEDPQNERVFWSSIYPKLIPVALSGDPDSPIHHVIERRVVDSK